MSSRWTVQRSLTEVLNLGTEVDIVNVKLGVVNPVADSASSLWRTIYMDGVIWHELGEHGAIVCGGFIDILPDLPRRA